MNPTGGPESQRLALLSRPWRQALSPIISFQERPFFVLSFVFLSILILSLFVGRYPTPYWMSPSDLLQDKVAQRLVLNLRLPRILTAALLGMTLSTAGTVMQMIFRNPLIEPGFLGVSQGAAFGAALTIIYVGAPPFFIKIFAILFACLGLTGSYLLARQIRHGGWILRLVLAGIAVSALFSSGVGILKYLADPLTQLPDIVFWMLGGLWGVTWSEVLYILPFAIPGLTVVYLMRWRLNLLSLGDETAFSLGAAPGRERSLILVSAVAATAAIVSVAGIVGWIGLIVPHVARSSFGANAQRALPASILIGGSFAMICDNLARTLLAGEIPLGILASLFGAFLFMTLLKKL